MALKSLKTDSLVHFAGLFYNQTVFQKSECSFLDQDQVTVDGKSVHVFHFDFIFAMYGPLVKKVSFRFLISDF